MSKVTKLTHDRLLEVLDCDPATGVFSWKVRSSNRIHIGDRAGVVASNGHRFISIDGEKFQASRLAWFCYNREWPQHDIKFANGNSDDCSQRNLRDVSRIAGARERGVPSNNTTGFKGVSPSKFGKFQAKLMWVGVQVSLGGNFDSALEAADVYEDAERRLAAAGDDFSPIMAQLSLEKRQRAAWFNLVRSVQTIGWLSFEHFCETVQDVPEKRYAMAPRDAALPIGPDNYRWSSEGHANTSTTAGKVQYARDNRRLNADHQRGKRFLKEYGIDFAQYQSMLLEQNGVCAICEKPETKIQNGMIRLLSVDHNHATGAVRGLLCANCNMAIGYACDDVSVLQKAIGYLRKYDGSSVIVPFDATSTLGFGA